MSSVVDGLQVSNAGAGTTTATKLKGGKYALMVTATFGGGNIQLQGLAFDGSTWVNIGSSLTAAGLANFDLGPGQYRLNITTATAVYATLIGVPS